jgi:hypothetical protein
VRIRGVDGRLVRAWTIDPAAGDLEWDGRDAAGRRVPAGVYLLDVSSAGRHARQKLLALP